MLLFCISAANFVRLLAVHLSAFVVCPAAVHSISLCRTACQLACEVSLCFLRFACPCFVLGCAVPHACYATLRACTSWLGIFCSFSVLVLLDGISAPRCALRILDRVCDFLVAVFCNLYIFNLVLYSSEVPDLFLWYLSLFSTPGDVYCLLCRCRLVQYSLLVMSWLS